MLEVGRSLTLAEKAGAGAEEVLAAPGFRFVATMNPGGDYGKRELSPALFNRFTSIWVPATSDPEEMVAILGSVIRGTIAHPLPVPCSTQFVIAEVISQKKSFDIAALAAPIYTSMTFRASKLQQFCVVMEHTVALSKSTISLFEA